MQKRPEKQELKPGPLAAPRRCRVVSPAPLTGTAGKLHRTTRGVFRASRPGSDGEGQGCNRLPPVHSPGALRPLMPPRRSVVSGVFLLISPVVQPVPACSPRRAGRSTVRFTPESAPLRCLLTRSHSLCSLALRLPGAPFLRSLPVLLCPSPRGTHRNRVKATDKRKPA